MNNYMLYYWQIYNIKCFCDSLIKALPSSAEVKKWPLVVNSQIAGIEPRALGLELDFPKSWQKKFSHSFSSVEVYIPACLKQGFPMFSKV